MSEIGSGTKVRGVISRSAERLVNSRLRDDKIDLDSLPFYAWDLLEGFPERYKAPLFSTHRTPAAPILTSRGCPGKCIFCFSGCHNTLSTYSSEYIIRLLKHLQTHYGIREFMIHDDNFVMFKNNLIELLSMLISENLEMSWSCNARVDMVDENVLALMAKAGCWQISYGIETGNQKIMQVLEKNITREKVAHAISISRKAGIRTVGYFMIGHFGETPETIEETIRFACSIGLDDFRMSFFTPLPGTKAALLATQYGTFENDWSKMNLFAPVFTPVGMDKEQLLAGQKRALRKFFFRLSVVWSFLKMVRNPFLAIRGAYLFAIYVMKRNG
ncbi:MAG: radical SAM protein [Nitrospirae bacterium]|nr:radical SAM protein [Nitrospirota bacterium]